MNPKTLGCWTTLLALGIGFVLGGRFFHSRPSGTSMAAVERVSEPHDPDPVQVDMEPALRPEKTGTNGAANPLVGVVFARQSADIVARTDGILEAVYVNLGDRLKPGDVIARNESRSLNQQLQVAEATLRSTEAEQNDAEVDLADSQSRFERRKELAESGLVSLEDLATAKAQVERSRAKVEMAKAHVAEQQARIRDNKESISNTVVRALFAGTVSARYVDPGATVRSGTPIVALIRAEDLWVRFAAPEAWHGAALAGAAIRFQADGTSEPVPGIVQHVAPAVAAMSQEVIVEAQLKIPPNLKNEIKPGASGSVWIGDKLSEPAPGTPARLIARRQIER